MRCPDMDSAWIGVALLIAILLGSTLALWMVR